MRRFRVEVTREGQGSQGSHGQWPTQVQDRIRSRPILVPNVLVNKTVDVNGTVDFSCQVISDLVPHIVWIKLVRKDGSFIRWDPKQRQYTFNFMDMNTQKVDGGRTERRDQKHRSEGQDLPRQAEQQVHHGAGQRDHGRPRHLLLRGRQHSWHGQFLPLSSNPLLSVCAVTILSGFDFPFRFRSPLHPDHPDQSMANATLTVNEFRPLTLPTDVSHSWPLSYTVLLILSFLLLCAFIALGMLYLFFSKKFSAKNRIQTLDSMSVRKKVGLCQIQ